MYLHGVGDSRASGVDVIRRYTRLGYDVIAYDSRAHGESQGTMCTYGFFEKQDLLQILKSVEHEPVALIGSSLGGAVALQAAAMGANISVIVAAEAFSDLRTIAVERAPAILPSPLVAQALELAERRARFQVDAVSPADSAARIRIPVLLIHGESDQDTPASHSARIFSRLSGPKRFLRVAGAAHGGSLAIGSVWDEIDSWIGDAFESHR